MKCVTKTVKEGTGKDYQMLGWATEEVWKKSSKLIWKAKKKKKTNLS